MVTVLNKRKGGKGIYIGRPSDLGNPFPLLREEDRDDCLDKYRVWLLEQMKSNTPARRMLFELIELARAGDVNLLCYCKPKKCHGDILKYLIDTFLELESSSQHEQGEV
jgi:hypothetical protein